MISRTEKNRYQHPSFIMSIASALVMSQQNHYGNIGIKRMQFQSSLQ